MVLVPYDMAGESLSNNQCGVMTVPAFLHYVDLINEEVVTFTPIEGVGGEAKPVEVCLEHRIVLAEGCQPRRIMKLLSTGGDTSYIRLSFSVDLDIGSGNGDCVLVRRG